MSVYSKYILSNSTDGKQILVSSFPTLIHSATGAPNTMDEVWLYAYNDATSSLSCSIYWGGTTEPNDVIRISLPPRDGRILVADGKILQNSLTISASAEKLGFVSLDGFVNRIDNTTSGGNTLSCSYALTSSYALNGGDSGILLVIPSYFPITPPTGSAVYISPNLYIYNGATWDTASLN